MKNILKNTLFLLLLFLCLVRRPDLTLGVISGTRLWQKCLFPSIFPLLILSDFALSTGVIELLSNSIGIFFKKIFKVPKESFYVIFMSFFTGCPSNAKYIKDLLDNKIIDEAGAIKILSMAQLYNPNLIFTITPFLNLKCKLFIIIGNLCINLIIGLFNRSFPVVYSDKQKKKISFSLTNSMSNAVYTLLGILGSIVTFSAIAAILKINHPLFIGILEITNGINKISGSVVASLFMIAILLSFGGLSILYQIKGILKEYKLDYTLYYKSRIIHLVLFLIFTFIFVRYFLWFF